MEAISDNVTQIHSQGAPQDQLLEIFLKQKAAFSSEMYPSVERRRENLNKLYQAVLKHQDALVQAVSEDYGHRSHNETRMLEILPITQAIKYTKKHLKKWMSPQKRHVSIWFKPARAKVMLQPLGVVGIISPWNYPVSLLLIPLLTALAAGNRVMIKPSEYTPKTNEAMRLLLNSIFPESLVSIVTGGPEVGASFANIPFDHLFYTGSTDIGHKIMASASNHLTPVTLELGGKSPTIIGADYPIEKAAKSIWAGKLFNAGQTCVAPDFVMLPKDKIDAFIAASHKVTQKMFSTYSGNPDYSCIINERHHERLHGLLEDAKSQGATLIHLRKGQEVEEDAQQKMSPVIVLEAAKSMQLLQDEIFGPILPVIAYDDLSEVTELIAENEHPLALYYFGYDKQDIETILQQTQSGGVTINDTILHVAQDDLPFGGVGQSGMGSYHAKEGFETFSHKKSVLTQSKFNSFGLFHPPYRKWHSWVAKWLIR